MSTNLNNSFTLAFGDELKKQPLYYTPPHLKSVAALPFRISLFTLQQICSMQNCLFSPKRLHQCFYDS